MVAPNGNHFFYLSEKYTFEEIIKIDYEINSSGRINERIERGK